MITDGEVHVQKITKETRQENLTQSQILPDGREFDSISVHKQIKLVNTVVQERILTRLPASKVQHHFYFLLFDYSKTSCCQKSSLKASEIEKQSFLMIQNPTVHVPVDQHQRV